MAEGPSVFQTDRASGSQQIRSALLKMRLRRQAVTRKRSLRVASRRVCASLPAKISTARQNAQVLFAFCRMSLVYHGCRCLMGGEPRLRVEPGGLVAVAGMIAIGATWPFATGLVKVSNPP